MISGVVEGIKEQLTEYAKKHSYCFNLNNVDKVIQMTSEKPDERYKILLEKYASDVNHLHRVEWMYEILTYLTSESLSEADVLIKVDACIQSLKLNAEQWKHFNTTKMSGLITSIETDVKAGLEALPKLPPTPHRDSTIQEAAEEEERKDETSSSGEDGGELQSLIPTERDFSEAPLDKPSVNIVVAMFKRWEKIYSGRFIDEGKRRDFIRFLKDLCYIGDGTAFQNYQLLAASTHQHEACRDWYAQIERGLKKGASKELKTFAKASAEMLLPNIRQPQTRLAEITKKQKEEERLAGESRQRATHHLEKKLNVSQTSRFAWSERRYKKLEAFINAFNEGEKNSLMASEFLEKVTRYLLQIRDDDSASVDTALDEYLSKILAAYIRVTDLRVKSFYEVFAKSLLALGANPLPCMEGHHASIGEASQVYYVAAGAAPLILSLLVHRARYLGECSVVLAGAMERLISATLAFAERLHRSVETDNAWWWCWLTKKFTSTPDGAKLERAAVYSALLQWMEVLLNKDIVENNTTSAKASQVKVLLVEANKTYADKVPKDQLFCNLGRKEWESLQTVITEIAGKVDGLGAERNSYALLLGTMDANQHELRARRLKQEPLEMPVGSSIFRSANEPRSGALPARCART